ncbi:hypothetical protein PG988_002942 [Apiospora saccharicola]
MDLRYDGTRLARRKKENTYDREKRDQGEVRAEECREYFQEFPQFAQREVLSVGGFGVVVKFAQVDAEGRTLRHFVVKIPREYENNDGGEDIVMFQREYLWNVLIWLDQYPIGNPLENGPFHKGNESFYSQDSPWYLFMEYLPHGDLRELLYRLNEREEADPFVLVQAQIPARLMWRIFLCRKYTGDKQPSSSPFYTATSIAERETYFLSVTRACIGLAWPRLTYEEAGEMAVSGEVQRIPEVVEEIGPIAPASIVHFDFDPANVIIGDFQDNAPEHALQPVFKLADFGLTQEVTAQTTVEELKKWQNGGKTGYRAPEQVLGRLQGDLGLVTPDLTTYGPHTNVWGMGVTMFALITKTKPPRIPQFSPYTCTLQDQDADTYGWFLAQTEENRPIGAADIYAKYPEELRHLVARCMALDPLQRPTLGYLLPVIQQAIAQGDELELQGRNEIGERDADIEAFCIEYIVGVKSEPSVSNREEDAEAEEARDVLGDLAFPGQQNAARAARRTQSQSRGLAAAAAATRSSRIAGFGARGRQ